MTLLDKSFKNLISSFKHLVVFLQCSKLLIFQFYSRQKLISCHTSTQFYKKHLKLHTEYNVDFLYSKVKLNQSCFATSVCLSQSHFIHTFILGWAVNDIQAALVSPFGSYWSPERTNQILCHYFVINNIFICPNIAFIFKQILPVAHTRVEDDEVKFKDVNHWDEWIWQCNLKCRKYIVL